MAPLREKDKRINEAIAAREVSVIDDLGENLGMLPLDEAIRQATEKNLDLVEIGNRDGVVLTKMMDYGKFVFRQQKNLAKNRHNSKQADIKTIRLTYKIGDHDLEVRRKQAEKFAKDGSPLKIVLQLRGRENQYEKLAIEKIHHFIESLAAVYHTDATITRTGNVLGVVLRLK